MVLHGQAFTSLPSDLPNVSSSSKIGRSFSFGPAYCSSTCRTAAFKYTSIVSSSPPFPSARSASHQALFVPSLCFVFSHSRLDFSSVGASFFTNAIHSSTDRPVLPFNSATHSPSSPRPGALRTANRFSRQLLSACRHLSTSSCESAPQSTSGVQTDLLRWRTGHPRIGRQAP